MTPQQKLLNKLIRLKELVENQQKASLDQVREMISLTSQSFTMHLEQNGFDKRQIVRLTTKLRDPGRRSPPWKAFSSRVPGRPQDGAKFYNLDMIHFFKSFTFLSLNLIFLISTQIFAQNTFVKTYGGQIGDYGMSVVKTFDGGFAFCGGTYTSNLGSSDIKIMVAKTDSIGNLLWMKQYSTNQINYANRLVQTADSGFVISGTSLPFNSNYQQDVFLIKVNSQGDSVWGGTIGSPGTSSEYANNLMQTRKGSLVTIGQQSPSVINYMYMTKTRSDGSNGFGKTLMSSWIGGVGYGATEALDGNYLFSGVHGSGQTRYNVLLKTDTSGNVIWAKRWLRQGNKGSIPNCLVQLQDSSIIIGSTINYDPNNNLSDTWIARCNPNGDTLKTWVFANCRVSSLFPNTDGGFTICGQTPGFSPSGRLFRVTADGQTIVWEKTYSFYQSLNLKDAIQFEDKGFLLVGSGFSNSNQNQAVLIRTDSVGNATAPTAIAYVEAENEWVAYPNPTDGKLYLKLGRRNIENIRIVNLLGIEVMNKKVEKGESMEISFTELPKGLYRIELKGKDFKSSKFVVVK